MHLKNICHFSQAQIHWISFMMKPVNAMFPGSLSLAKSGYQQPQCWLCKINGSSSMSGFPQVTMQQWNFLTFSWPTPNFHWLFAAWKYIRPYQEFTWVTHIQKMLQLLFGQKKHDLLFLHAIPTKLWLDLQNVQILQKYISQFSCISCRRLWDWATISWHWQSKFGMRPSYWYQLHFSLFLIFLVNFKIFSTFSWPVGTLMMMKDTTSAVSSIEE